MVERDIAHASNVERTVGSFREGRNIVAVVGIDQYKAWPTLENAVNDARGVREQLLRLRFQEICDPIFDQMATADALRRLVTDNLRTLHSEDSLVLFFAGHGHKRVSTLPDASISTGFIIPVDGEGAEGSPATWLRLDTWLSDVARLPARHILVILDACRSGIALGSLVKWRGSSADPLDELRRLRSRRVITSALGDQRAADSGPVVRHSLFTGYLINALSGGLKQREVTGSQIGLYVREQVIQYPGSAQTPDFGALELDDRGELVIRLTPPPDMAEVGNATAPAVERTPPPAVLTPAMAPVRTQPGRMTDAASCDPSSSTSGRTAIRALIDHLHQAVARSTYRLRRSNLSRRTALAALVIFGATYLAVVMWPRPAVLGAQYTANRNSFIGACPWLNWILYEPTGYDPVLGTGSSESTIHEDLRVLREHGFDGLITMGSHGILQHVPRIAHEEKFQMVIVGVWEINDEDEVNNALKAAPYADAYCLGHRGLNKRYPISLLRERTNQFRTATNRPTTTTELVLDYETDPELVTLSDFLFPDVHTEWQRSRTPVEAWTETIALAQRAAKIAAAAQGKHVLLKMVSYPSGGGQGLSPQSQLEFYRLAVEQASDRNDIPARISFSFFGAFDPVWKTEHRGWPSSEQFTGLFTEDRRPKPAITEIRWGKPR